MAEGTLIVVTALVASAPIVPAAMLAQHWLRRQELRRRYQATIAAIMVAETPQEVDRISRSFREGLRRGR